jgi:hypothetical protein
MKKVKSNPRQKSTGNKNREDGYKQYPPDEDIFNKAKQESDIDLDEISEKRQITNKGIPDKNDFIYDEAEYEDEIDPSDDLDEDADRSFYSLTDDRLDDLEDIFER